MKSRFKLNSLKAVTIVGVLGFGLVAWSPPSSDKVVDLAVGSTNSTVASAPTVVLGGGNVLDGTVTGRGIVVGQNNTSGAATASGTRRFSIILGESNVAVSRNTLVVGYQNSLTPSGDDYTTAINHSAVFGLTNVLNTGGNSGLLVSGTSNTILHANNSFAAGTSNQVGGLTSGAKSFNSAAIGFTNNVSSTVGWAMGSENAVTSENGLALGVGARSTVSKATAIGRYNAPMVAGDVLVVGAGASDGVRSNAIRVTDDGSVLLGRAQGDISMGIYN